MSRSQLTKHLRRQLTVHLAGNQYLTGLTLYFIGYVLFEVSSLSPFHGMSMLKIIGTLQYRPQVDFSTTMASHLDSSMGSRRNSAWSCPKYERILRRTLLPWSGRKWPLSRGCILPLNVVSQRRAALPCLSVLQRCISGWCLWWYPGLGET